MLTVIENSELSKKITDKTVQIYKLLPKKPPSVLL